LAHIVNVKASGLTLNSLVRGPATVSGVEYLKTDRSIERPVRDLNDAPSGNKINRGRLDNLTNKYRQNDFGFSVNPKP
jgi:hypothetical protein